MSDLSAQFRITQSLDHGEEPTTQLTQFGTVMGTPDFIAPEQARSPSTSDIRADLYSVGCTFYFLLTGQVPFASGGMTEKLLAHQFDEPPAVGVVRGGAQQPFEPDDAGQVEVVGRLVEQ